MEKSNKIPIFRRRLIKLRKEHHYTQTYIAEKLEVTTKTYRTWEKGVYISTSNSITYPEIDSNKLIKLSDIYSVSVDYLLGHSDCVSVENSYINELTGLCDNAINALKIIKRSNYINTLNFVMRDYALLGAFLSNVELYLNNKFDTPVHFDDKLGIFVESKDVSDSPVLISSNEKYVSIGRKLDYEVAGQAAFETLSVPVSILESHALHCIQQLLDDWKKEYKKEND